MRRKEITLSIKRMAGNYARHLEDDNNFNKDQSPRSRLYRLEHQLRLASAKVMIEKQPRKGKTPAVWSNHKGKDRQEIADYVKAIADNYVGLNNALPSKYLNYTNKIEPKLKGINIEKVRVKIGKKNWTLVEHIVEAMRYDYVQEKLMQQYVRKLGIKSCCYCNAQFAVTAIVEKERKIDKKGNLRVKKQPGSFYELDHNLPKSKYPYLCTNFYNLQPCCSSCNRRKNDRELGFSIYYEPGDVMPLRPLHFALGAKELIDYRVKNKCHGITAHLCNAGSDVEPVVGDGSLADRFNELLGVNDVYKEFSDEIEEILWRHKMYSAGMLTSLNTQMSALVKSFDFKRYILGTYADEEQAAKRPLTVMAQDIWEQVEGKKAAMIKP